MAYTNAGVTIVLGNVESRLDGPGPWAALDRALNGWMLRCGRDPGHPTQPRIFDPASRAFLTGALPRVKRVLRRAGVRFRVRDLRGRCRPTLALGSPTPPLRPYQADVVERALRRGTGVIDIGTGGGKTRIAAEIIHRVGRPTLYLVTTRTLLQQAVRHLREYLGIDPGTIGAGLDDPRPLTVALVQSLQGNHHPLEAWRNGCVVFDEGHHGCAPTYLSLLRRIDARYNFFLSAVPFRSGGDQELLDALTSGSITDGAFSAGYLIDHGYAAPVKVRLEQIAIRGHMTERPFWQLYDEKIVDNAERNGRIVALARGEADRGRSVLVLVEQIRHGRDLRARLDGTPEFACGETPRAELQALTDRFARGERRVLIATVGLFNEGVSIDGIQCVINAGGLKSRVKVLQMIGRGMRLAPGKSHVLYVDFLDDCETGVFRAHSRQRIRILRQEGFVVPPVEPARRTESTPDPIAAAWAPVPGTQRFIQVTAEGEVVARGRCFRKESVPPRFCRSCRQPNLCREGGIITWRKTD